MPTGYKVIQLKREVFQVKAFSLKKKKIWEEEQNSNKSMTSDVLQAQCKFHINGN